MIFMSQSGLVDDTRRTEWDGWYLEHLAIMATVPGMLSAQRFTTISPGHPPSLAIYTVTSAEVFRGSYYQQIRGMGDWLPLIDRRHYRRNLFEGLDRAPEVADGQVMLIEDLQTMPDGDAAGASGGASGHVLRSVGLDQSTPFRRLQVLADDAAAGAGDASVAVYLPASQRFIGRAG
jgi:hypothetical protein